MPDTLKTGYAEDLKIYNANLKKNSIVIIITMLYILLIRVKLHHS